MSETSNKDSLNDYSEQKFSWVEKKESILDDLERMVESAFALQKLIEGVSIEDSHQEVKDKLLNFLEEQKLCFSPETIEKFAGYKVILAEENAVNKEMEKMGDYDIYDAQEDKKYSDLTDKFIAIERERCKLLEDDNVKFLQKIENILEDLKQKNNYIKETLENGGEDKFKKDFVIEADKYEDKIKYAEIKKVTVSPFDIVFDTDRKSAQFYGLYYSSSPFISLFNAGDVNREATVRHEKIHNILNKSEIFEYPAFEIFEKKYKELNMCRGKIHAGEYVDEFKIKNIKEELSMIKPFDILDENHEEIIAEAEHADRMDFASPRSYYVELENILKHDPDDDVKDIVLNLILGLRAEVTKMSDKMKEAKDMAKAIGPDAEDRLNILFLMLNPSKYRHIKTYFEHIYKKKLKVSE